MGKPTSPLPLNDETNYGLCSACGPRSDSGLRLLFEREGNRISTTYRAREIHQGFPRYLHGGAITALLDEVMSRVSLLDNRWTITASLQVRFRHPITTEQTVKATAEKTREVRRFIEARGTVSFPDGRVAAEATGRFALLESADLARISGGYPQLAAQWGMR